MPNVSIRYPENGILLAGIYQFLTERPNLIYFCGRKQQIISDNPLVKRIILMLNYFSYHSPAIGYNCVLNASVKTAVSVRWLATTFIAFEKIVFIF